MKKLTVPLRIKTKDEIVEGKRITEFADKCFELDVTLNAQMRWEQKFPAQAETEELVTYAARFEKLRNFWQCLICRCRTIRKH